MQEPENANSKQQPQEKAEYVKPTLREWGTLRELTRGGGGAKTEPSHAKTRF